MLQRLKNTPLAWELRRSPIWRLYHSTSHGRDQVEFYKVAIEKTAPGCIIDVGANNGSKSEIFRELASRVVAIEPDPKSAATLRNRFRWRNVEVCEFAVSDRPGTIPFLSFEPGSAYNTASADWANCMTRADGNHMKMVLPQPEAIQVEAMPLSYFLQSFWPVKYLKVDAEGFEEQVLSTLNKPVPLVSLEFNFPHMEQAFKACLTNLMSIGDYRFNAAITEPPLKFELPHWVGGDEIVDVIRREGWLYIELYAVLPGHVPRSGST